MKKKTKPRVKKRRFKGSAIKIKLPITNKVLDRLDEFVSELREGIRRYTMALEDVPWVAETPEGRILLNKCTGGFHVLRQVSLEIERLRKGDRE